MRKNVFLIILVVCIIFLLGYIVFDKFFINNHVKEPTKEQLKLNEIEKLKKGLIKAGYSDIGDGKYMIKDFESETINQDTGKPINFIYTTFSINNLTIESESKNPLSYLTEGYSFKTNIASGSLSEYLSFTQFNYDFNHGTSTCDRDSCSTYINNLIGLKNRFMNIISDNNVNLEYLK